MPTATPTSSSGLAYPKVLGWSLKQHIGGGGFSKVFRGINPSHPQHRVAAVKVVSLLRNPPPDRRALQKEVQIHAILKHPHILTFLGVEERGIIPEERGRYLPAVYIVLELAGGGDLFDKITPDVGVETDLAHLYFTQLIAGLEYVHGQGIAHRDIKPENMLLDDLGNLKIADFGLCSVYKHKGREREMRGACGSLPYIAPEMNGKPYRGEPVDVWSAGVVLFALLVGNTPWDEPTSRAPEYVAYLNGSIFEYDPWNRIPGDEISLLKGMMNPDPTKRLDLEAVKRHRWYRRANKLLMPEPGSTQCTDPTTLAERLLQGLIMNGEMDYATPLTVEQRAKQLHSDGARAEVPDTVSFTQPEAVQGRTLHLGGTAARDTGNSMLPPSTALPRIDGPAASRRSDFLDTLSQQLTSRREEFAHSQLQAPRRDSFSGGRSQFTETINFLTQPPSASYRATKLSLTPNLTRFFSHSQPSVIASRLAIIFQSMRAQHVIEPLGDAFLGEEDGERDAVPGPDMMSGNANDMDVDAAAGQVQDTISRSSSASDMATIVAGEAGSGAASRARTSRGSGTSVPEGSKGIRIRLALIDTRKCQLKGEVRIERLSRAHDEEGREEQEADAPEAQCLVTMRRSRGDPLEWRKVFGKVVKDSHISECICR